MVKSGTLWQKGEEGVKKNEKNYDIIYGQPLMVMGWNTWLSM